MFTSGRFEWIYGVNSIEPIDIIIWPVFERNAIVRLFSDTGSHMHSCKSLLLSTIIFNDIYIYEFKKGSRD